MKRILRRLRRWLMWRRFHAAKIETVKLWCPECGSQTGVRRVSGGRSLDWTAWPIQHCSDCARGTTWEGSGRSLGAKMRMPPHVQAPSQPRALFPTWFRRDAFSGLRSDDPGTWAALKKHGGWRMKLRALFR